MYLNPISYTTSKADQRQQKNNKIVFLWWHKASMLCLQGSGGTLLAFLWLQASGVLRAYMETGWN